MLKTLDQIQHEVGQWASHEFGQNVSRDNENVSFGYPLGSLPSLLGMIEELGELCRAVGRRHQGRGHDNSAAYRAAKEDAVADLLVFLCDFACRENINLTSVLNEVWARVQKRRREHWVQDKAREATSGDRVNQQ